MIMLTRAKRRNTNKLLKSVTIILLIFICIISIIIYYNNKKDFKLSFHDQSFEPSLQWKKEWWESEHFQSQVIPHVTDQCPLCNFTPTQISPSSSESDVIFTVAIDQIVGLPTTIRSIRTAGIKAAIVIMADQKAVSTIDSDAEVKNMIQSCGAILINIGYLDQHQMKGRYRTRWHLAYDYFTLNPCKFKRFVMTDAYDSFFQGDPFLSDLKDDSVYFSTESISIDRCMHNTNWIKEIYPESIDQMKGLPIICAGPVAGGVQPFLKLCKIIFSLSMWEEKWDTPPDQAYINYVVHTKLLEKENIPYVVVPNDGFMTTVGYCDRKGNLTIDSNGNIGCPGFKSIPMLLHQYFRPHNMREHFLEACKSNNPLAFKKNPYSKASF